MNVSHNISLSLQSNITSNNQFEGDAQKNKSKVIILCNDKILDDKYAITAKKVESPLQESGIGLVGSRLGDESNRVKLVDKYFWTPLKVKDSEGNETWVKVSRKDLEKKYFINNSELEKVTSGAELENLIKIHVDQMLLAEEKKSENGIIHSIIKFFLGYFVLSPTIENCIHERNQHGELSNLYIHQSQEILSDVKDTLAQNNQTALGFFGDEMISQIIDEVLIKEAEWDDSQVQKFNKLRKIDFFRKNPDMLDDAKQLETIDFSKIPVSELASIPVTDTNRDVLSQIWKKEINNLHTKGKLGTLLSVADRRGILIQAHYANKYLEFYYSMPGEVRNDLFEFFQNLQHPEQLNKITNFALQYSPIAQGEVLNNVNLQRLQQEQEIYSKKIKPLIQQEIEKHSQSADSSDLLKVYTQIEKKQTVDFLLKKINEQLLPIDKQFFDKNRLNFLIAQEIETTLAVDYHFTSSQIANLRNYKENYSKKIEDHHLFCQMIADAPKDVPLMALFILADMIVPSNETLEKKSLSNSLPFIEVGLEIDPLKNLDRELTIEKLLTITPFLNKKLSESTLTQEEKLELDQLVSNLSDEYNVKFDEMKKINESKKEYVNNSIKLKRGSAYIDWMLFSPETEQDVSNGQNSSGLSSDQQNGLMKVNLILNKNKSNILNPEETSEISELESREISVFLEGVRKDPQLIKVLEGFRNKEPNQLINDVLDITPDALQGIMKRILPEDPLPTKAKKIPAGLSQDTIEFVLTYVERLTKMEKMAVSLQAVQSKADELLRKFDNNIEISKEERLTLKELGILSTAERLSKKRFDTLGELDFVKELETLGLLKLDPKLQKFAEKVEKSAEILRQIESKIRPGINSHYRGGDIFAYNISKKEQWRNKPLFWGEYVVAFVSDNFTHGGKLYQEESGTIKTSHIFDDFLNEEFPLYEICVSDVWGIDVAPLVPEALQSKMRITFGDQWQDRINGKYREIENDLEIKAMKSGKFKKMWHHGEKKFLAGAANYAPVLNTLFGADIKGHQGDYEKDFNKLHEKFFNEKELDENQICSEFASKITLACMIELNKWLTRELSRTYGERVDNFCILEDMEKEGKEIDQDVRDYVKGIRHFGKDREITLEAEKKWNEMLEERGYSPTEIELAIRIGNKEILDLPYSKKERLRAIHPGRMVSLLIDKKCAVKREPPPVVQALIYQE